MNFGDKAKQVISSVAPLIGTAIGGPFGGLAGAVLGKLFGSADKPADQAAIEQAITSGNPDALLKLKQADNEFAEHMKQLDIDEEKLSYDDRANARAREVAVRDTTPRNLAYTYTIGFFALLAAQVAIVIMHIPIEPGAVRMLDATTGILFAMMLGSKEYYFGSSAGSDKKTDVLADIAKS